MLSEDDAKLVERDDKLPGLATLLDDESACRLFQHHFDRLPPRSARCTYLRYKPGVSCLAAFAIETCEGIQTAHVTAYRADAADKLAKASERATLHNARCPAPIVVPELAIVISPFPCDSELSTLEQVYSRDGQIQMLSRLTPDDDNSLVFAQWTQLRYKPGRRYVARLDVDNEPQAVLKLHSAAEYAQARRATKSFGSSVGVNTANTLGHSDRLRAILTRWLPGKPLLNVLNDPESAIPAMEATGHLIAQLHGLSISKLPLRNAQQEAEELKRLADDFAAVSPELADSMQNIAQRCSDRFTTLPLVEVPIHGDFHPQQILIDVDSPAADAALIDFDSAALSHPACDIGNLLAHLYRESLRGSFSQNQLERLTMTFLDTYAEQHPSLNPSAVQVYLASGLLRLAHEPFRHRQRKWHEETQAIVQRALEVLGDADFSSNWYTKENRPKRTHAEQPTNIKITYPFSVIDDLALSNVSMAIDANFAKDAITPIIRQAFRDDGLTLSSIRVQRHKPGRRCLLKYSFVKTDSGRKVTVLGKIHAKSRHDRSFRLQQGLWESDFDYHSADGISVARPLGTVPEVQMWLQECVPGTVSWGALSGPNGETIAARIAEAAHKLHQADIITERVHTIEDELQILEEKLPQVVRLMPQLKSRIDVVLAKCRELANSIPITQQTGIHRDFYPDQVLVDGDRFFLLDHDLYCMGDPNLDIGNFIGHLIEYSLRKYGTPGMFAAGQSALVERYCSLRKDSLSTVIDAYSNLTLVRHIYLSTRIAGRSHSTLQILDYCEVALSRNELAMQSASDQHF